MKQNVVLHITVPHEYSRLIALLVSTITLLKYRLILLVGALSFWIWTGCSVCNGFCEPFQSTDQVPQSDTTSISIPADTSVAAPSSTAISNDARVVRWGDSPIAAIAFSSDGTIALVATENRVGVLAVPSLNVQQEFDFPFQKVQSVQWDRSGKRVLVAGGDPGQRGTLFVLSWPEWTVQNSVELQEDVCMDLSVSPEEHFIAVATMARTVYCLSTEDLKIVERFTDHSKAVMAVEWEHEGVLVSASIDASLRVRSVQKNAIPKTLSQHKQSVVDLSMSPAPSVLPTATSSLDSTTQTPRILASCSSDGTVRFWQPSLGRLLRFYSVQKDKPTRLQWLGRSPEIAVGTESGNVLFIDSRTVNLRSQDQVFDESVNALSAREDILGKYQILAGSESGRIAFRTYVIDTQKH